MLSTFQAALSNFCLALGQNQGISSSMFLFISLILFCLLKLMANLWASSLIFCKRANSGVHLGMIMESDFHGTKSSSSLLAMEQMLGSFAKPGPADGAGLEFKLEIGEMALRAELSCHFHQSIIMRSGQLSNFSASRRLLPSISSIDLKSSISHMLMVSSLYFLYLEESAFQFTITLLDATVLVHPRWDMS
jgi:hypothetical protein